MPFCPNCGNESNTPFCPICGTKLGQNEESSTQVSSITDTSSSKNSFIDKIKSLKKAYKIGIVAAALLLIVLIVCLISGNGNSIKSDLCYGVWVKQYKGTVFYGDWCTTDIYEFSTNGSFKRYCYDYWELGNGITEEIYTGKYQIDSSKNQIVLSYDQSASENKYYPEGGKYYIPYYINEYNHELLIEVDSSGNSNYRNYSSKDNINYIW